MGKFKVGDKVVWVVEKDYCYYGEVGFNDVLNNVYPVRIILDQTGNTYSFTEDGIYDITSSRTTYIRHLTKLERVLR